MRNNLPKISVLFRLVFFISIVYPINATGIPYIGKSDSYFYVKKPFTIVLDAGHGGKDSGTIGKHSMEKNIALEIALKMGRQIELHHPEVKVIYTRKDDTFIPLFERVALANQVNADLFISIHCNASPRKSAKGTETFVMGLHTADENLETAKLENSAILMEADFRENYDGFDPNSDAGHIILSMYQNLHLDQSIAFASLVEDALGIKTSRGVKQAGFVVLRRATMPAILIETGFLSNAEDEKRLVSDSGQDRICNALYKAFVKYRSAREAREPDIVSSDDDTTANDAPSKEYRVQIAAKREVKAELFPNVEGLKIIKEGDLYKYVTRSYPSYEDAVGAREKLIRDGYKEAFIVVYTLENKSLVQK